MKRTGRLTKLWRKVFGEPCFHDWKVLLNEHVPPESVQLENQQKGFWGEMIFLRKHTVIVTCKGCGKLKRFITGG